MKVFVFDFRKLKIGTLKQAPIKNKKVQKDKSEKRSYTNNNNNNNNKNQRLLAVKTNGLPQQADSPLRMKGNSLLVRKFNTKVIKHKNVQASITLQAKASHFKLKSIWVSQQNTNTSNIQWNFD